MSKLSALLNDNKHSVIGEQEVLLTRRFTDEEGNPVMAKIKPVTSKMNGIYRQRNMKNKGKSQELSFNQNGYFMDIILNHTVEPNFKCAEWLAEQGLALPEELVDQSLQAGEVDRLANNILEISGFGDADEIEQETKNF